MQSFVFMSFLSETVNTIVSTKHLFWRISFKNKFLSLKSSDSLADKILLYYYLIVTYSGTKELSGFFGSNMYRLDTGLADFTFICHTLITLCTLSNRKMYMFSTVVGLFFLLHLLFH